MRGVTAFAVGTLMFLAGPARPDEGMWLLNAPPTRLLKERHNFEPSADWLEHLQKSSVRFGAGGYGTCLSCDGEISERRLRALPFAVRCEVCEERCQIARDRARRLAVAPDDASLFPAVTSWQ